MSENMPWASPERLARLSSAPFGRKLTAEVADCLASDNGKRGIWNRHRDYCGHGLIFQDLTYRLIEVHDGFAQEGRTIKAWQTASQFVDWLADQSDYSMSGADEADPDLHASTAFSLNNQRITRSRLLAYVARRNALPVFRRFLDAVLEEFAFLPDDLGFTLTPPEQVGREFVVNYKAPHAGITVNFEPGVKPWMTVTIMREGAYQYRQHPIDRMIRHRVPDWASPMLRRDDDRTDYRGFFREYATVLRLHFHDLLVLEDATGDQSQITPGERSQPQSGDETQVPSGGGQRANRIIAAFVALAALVAMGAELRYFAAHGTPEATGSAYGNLGMLLLMSVPWVVFAGAVLQLITGVDIRRYNEQFDGQTIIRKVSITALIVVLTLLATLLIAWIA